MKVYIVGKTMDRAKYFASRAGFKKEEVIIVGRADDLRGTREAFVILTDLYYERSDWIRMESMLIERDCIVVKEVDWRNM